MKPDKRLEAQRLRREEGLAITEICKLLGVAKSSVSMWVRDIELTEAQKEELHRRHYSYKAQIKGSHTNAIRAKAQREIYQAEGRAKAHENDSLHVAGCMLYWGEGAKARNVLHLGNADADLVSFYVRFLRQSLQLDVNQIVVRIYCYLGNGIPQEDIETYWLDTLQLPRECLRKSVINPQPKSSQQKGRKLKYGVCTISVFSTRHVQHVFGAIQEYTGIDKPEWLM
jgi:predicted transcriptional regulator